MSKISDSLEGLQIRNILLFLVLHLTCYATYSKHIYGVLESCLLPMKM